MTPKDMAQPLRVDKAKKHSKNVNNFVKNSNFFT